jgi:hypothetical protein
MLTTVEQTYITDEALNSEHMTVIRCDIKPGSAKGSIHL